MLLTALQFIIGNDCATIHDWKQPCMDFDVMFALQVVRIRDWAAAQPIANKSHSRLYQQGRGSHGPDHCMHKACQNYWTQLQLALHVPVIRFARSSHQFLKIVFLHIPVLIPIPPLAISSQWAEETKYGDMAFIPMRVSANMIDTNSFRWAHLHNIWRVHLWCDAGHWRRSSNQSSGGE